MAVTEIFSKRQKRINGETPEFYVYESIPETLRAQIIHIITDTFGEDSHSSNASSKAFNAIHKTLCKEYGVFSLSTDKYDSDETAVLEYFYHCENHERCLDIIELAFKKIKNYVGKDYRTYKRITSSTQTPEDAIEELNLRFKEHGVGYEFASEELIRIDSQFLHSEAVKPALLLLMSNNFYNGANQEFLKAHENYRHKRYKECIAESLKSFESLMKGICEQHSWEYSEKDTAKNLINACIQNKLIPEYLQEQFSSFKSLLMSGIPTIRNKTAGHGQGADILEIPEHFASYSLHLTATNLLFLMQCNEQLAKE